MFPSKPEFVKGNSILEFLFLWVFFFVCFSFKENGLFCGTASFCAVSDSVACGRIGPIHVFCAAVCKSSVLWETFLRRGSIGAGKGLHNACSETHSVQDSDMILHLVLFPISIQHMFLSAKTKGFSPMVHYHVSPRRLIEELWSRSALPHETLVRVSGYASYGDVHFIRAHSSAAAACHLFTWKSFCMASLRKKPPVKW